MSEQNSTSHLIDLLTALVSPLGYEIVHLEVVAGRHKILRIFIDRLEANAAQGAVGIQDCVKVTRALDEPLDLLPEIEKLFSGANYELEVSSPGVDRPLRTERDYERFAGQEVRIHVYRPLTAEELGNPTYQNKNPKQKNFIGKLVGFRDKRVVLDVSSGGKDSTKAAKKSKKVDSAENGAPIKFDGGTQAASTSTKSADEVSIPLPLIAKANLEPRFESEFAKEERE